MAMLESTGEYYCYFLERFAEAAAAEGGARHPAQEVGEGVDAVEVQAFEGHQPVMATVVEVS